MTAALARVVRRPLGDAVPVLGATALVALCAYRFGEVFGGTYQPWGAVVAPFVQGVVALLLPPWRWWARGLVHLGTAVVLTVSAITASGGSASDLPGALLNGAGTILSGRWPAAPSPDAIGLLTFLAAAAGAVGAELAWHRRPPAALLLPPLGVLVATSLLAAPAGMPSAGFLALLAALSTLVLASAASARASADRRLVQLERSRTPRTLTLLLPAVVVAVLLSTLALAAASGTAARFDPRDERSDPTLPTAEISPLSRVDEWRSKVPAQVLFTGTGASVKRWRLVALTRYDGRAWMPPGDFRRAGSTISDAPQGAERVTVDVQVDQLDGRWVPMPAGEPLAVARAVRTDPTRSGLLADEELATGQTVRVRVAELVPDANRLAASAAVRRSARPVDGFEIPASLRSLATRVVEGAANDYERALRLAVFLKEQYSRADDAPAGHSLPLLQLFLERSKRGRDEQFVAAYALLAQAVGLPARVAVGFAADGDQVVRSDRATAWPEVEFDGVGWVAFDPVPDTQAPALGASSEGGGLVGQEQLPTPPTTAPPPPSTVPPDTPPEAAASSGDPVPFPVLVSGGSLVAAALVGIGYLVVVTVLKRRRRARLLAEGDERARVVGAFVVGMDWLTDLGAPARPQSTDRELVAVATGAVGEGGTALAPLADLATASVYADDPPAGEDLEVAHEALERFEGALPGLGRFRWWRARASMRSLRKPFPR